ncbi:MAG: response regulator [Elusimicrobiota bacterium]|nr:response regulator [Elusimicrobiota bacterium]
MIEKTDPKEKLILVVEDDETVIEFLKYAVEKDGFNTSIATDGEEAINKVKENKPDLIIVDMMLPKISGFELIKALQTPEYINIPIVVMTGKFINDGFRRTVELEPNVKEYIFKPVKPPYLLHRIHTILGTISPEEKAIEERKKILEKTLKPKQIDEEF